MDIFKETIGITTWEELNHAEEVYKYDADYAGEVILLEPDYIDIHEWTQLKAFDVSLVLENGQAQIITPKREGCPAYLVLAKFTKRDDQSWNDFYITFTKRSEAEVARMNGNPLSPILELFDSLDLPITLSDLQDLWNEAGGTRNGFFNFFNIEPPELNEDVLAAFALLEKTITESDQDI